MYNNNQSRQQQGKFSPTPQMMQIKIQFRKFGQYNIMETLDFGYRLSVKSNIKPDQNGMIVYDANNAQIMVNDKGYLCLYIN